MQKIHIIQDFDVPRERVFGFFSQHERLAEIYPGAFKRIVDSMDPTDVNGLGSVRRITNFPLIIDEKVTRYAAPSLIEYKLTQGAPIRDHVGIMHFYELDNGSRCRLDYTIEFEGAWPLSGFILKNLLERVVGGAVRDLAKRFRNDPNY